MLSLDILNKASPDYKQTYTGGNPGEDKKIGGMNLT